MTTFRKLFSLVAIALTSTTTGCLSPMGREPSTPTTVSVQQQPAQQQPTQPQNFGQNPQGFVADPANPNRGFIAVGGNMIPVVRGASGWEAETPERRRRNIMDSTPDRFEPMVGFLENHGLSLKDWHTLGEAYAQTEVTDQKANLRIQYLRSLNEVVQNQPPANLEAAVQNAKSLRSVLNQF